MWEGEGRAAGCARDDAEKMREMGRRKQGTIRRRSATGRDSREFTFARGKKRRNWPFSPKLRIRTSLLPASPSPDRSPRRLATSTAK
jgi:hypothetical protein